MKLSEAISVSSSYTGAGAARAILDSAQIKNVLVAAALHPVNEYDPKRRIIYLSLRTFYRSTAEAVATGAHEAGHVLQHAYRYWPFMVRMKLFQLARCIAVLLPLLLVAAIVLHSRWLIFFVIWLYAGLAVFHLLTIPIERDASDRAHTMLLRTGIIGFGSDESKAVQKILRSFLWSYIFAFVLAPVRLFISAFRKLERAGGYATD
jgi:Zn-dependent membrane protease YugP